MSTNLPAASAPDLFSFAQTDMRWADLCEADRRFAIAEMLDAVDDFGLHDSPQGRRAAYGDIIMPGEAPQTRLAYLEPGPNASSCGLLVRTLWRMLGAKDPLLDPPYRVASAITNILAYGRKYGACTDLQPGDDFQPRQGDVLLIHAMPGYGSQHIFTVYGVEDQGGTLKIVSVDGGQPSPNPAVQDGPCNGIHRRERTLDKATLRFTDDAQQRQVTQWIDADKLAFTEPVIRLSRHMDHGDVR